jgi:FAD:protein FMN transferase
LSRWAEAESFACFGSEVGIYIEGAGPERALAGGEIERARTRLLHIHGALSRFDSDSGLCQLNRDPRESVPASSLVVRLAGAVIEAAVMSGGLVDATGVEELEALGYARDWDPATSLALHEALAEASPRHAAGPDARARWRAIEVNPLVGLVKRPPGVRIDSGGLAKGLAADLVAAELEHFPCFAVDAGGDIRVGGTAEEPRAVSVEDPFGRAPVADLSITTGGIATSGIGRRAWRGPDGKPAHHLLDPATRRPAFTGVVQATALAPTAFEAEVRAKCAVLAGPGAIRTSLPHGGIVVYDDGAVEELGPVLGPVGAVA